MQVFNTLTRKKEELVPQTPGEFKIYCCGPTVYNYIHIGNSRPLCVFDVFRRYLEYRGYKVTFVQNFTDIDDKIIKRANEEGTDYKTISEKYIEEYWKDADGLNVRRADIHPKATEVMDEIIDIIQTLIDKGHAYVVENGDVYFVTSSCRGYGKLSHQPLDELQAGARINIGELKKEPMDFALWKAAKPGEPYWESPWGHGRPGWHIECSAMNRRYVTSARPSTFTAVARTSSSRTTRTRSRSPSAATTRRSRTTGCTTASSTSTTRRCPSPRATSSWSAKWPRNTGMSSSVS